MAASLKDYEIREGTHGQMGIYPRAYNIKLATFVPNSKNLQTALRRVFDKADRAERRKQERRAQGKNEPGVRP